MSEDFLNRWARLKRESATKRPRRGGVQTTISASPPLDPASAPVDVSSLSPIESISAESSVAAFLQAGVPDDLTRAALRHAWASDPAIRDFVGIAENQWDFNSEGTIGGFGSLSAEEYAQYVATRALGAEGATTEMEVKNADGSESSGAIGRDDSADGPPTPSASSPPQQSGPIGQQPVSELHATCASPGRVLQPSSVAQTRRTHGSALPR
jgi:Protein of unknown function (DUF3306)